MNKFLDTYKINVNDLEDFNEIFHFDRKESVKKVYKSRLKTDIKQKKLSLSCRAFIMFMTNNLDKKRNEVMLNIEEIIIDKPIIKEKVKVKAEVIESSDESEIDESSDESSYDPPSDDEYNKENDFNNHFEDGSTQIDMKKWRESQSKKFYGVSKEANKQYTKKHLLSSIEWIKLEDLKKIPKYIYNNLDIPGAYHKGLHDDLVKIFNKLEA